MPRTRPELTSAQLHAVQHISGPMLVRAGAGTGKTTVMVERISHLIRHKLATASEILATTFTLDAAHEIRQRVRESLGKSGEGVRCDTFHGICNDILRVNDAGFELLDQQNLWVYLRRMIDARQLPLRFFQKASDPAKFLNDFIQFFDRCNDELVDAAQYRAYVNSLAPGSDLPRVHAKKDDEDISDAEIIDRCREIADVFETVEKRLQTENLGTFGMMIVRAVRLLEQDASVLQQERARTKFILVDEFQDCNTAQIRFARLLAGPDANLFAVGDPDQAIYRFRGASSAAFDEFKHYFPAANSVTLAENQRSLSPVLECAYTVIAENREVRSDYSRTKLDSARELRAHAAAERVDPAPVEIVVNESGAQEAYDIAQQIVRRRKEDRKARWQDFAVIYRQHSHRIAIVEEFGARKIPFVVVGTDLLNTAPLRDLIAVLKALDSSDDISLFRMALMPRFGIDLDWLRTKLRSAHRDQPLTGILASSASGNALLQSLRKFRETYDLRSTPALKMVERAIAFFGFTRGEELDRLVEFVDKSASGPLQAGRNLEAFLQYLEYFQQAGGKLAAEPPRDASAVRLMTAHGAKGLEFPHVFVVRVKSGSFPLSYGEPLFEFPDKLRASVANSGRDPKDQHDEEERRLFYVAMTRARDTLALHGKRSGFKQPVPSIFLRQLDANKGLKPRLCNTRDAQRLLFDLEANAPSVVEKAAWLNLSPTEDTKPTRLSVYAVETYAACPLRFKLERQWNLPAEPAAAMQFGAAMHRVLHEHFRSLSVGRRYSELELIEIFRNELTSARLVDPVQHELYEKQGIEQLRRFLKRTDLPTDSSVIGTEQRFSITVEGTEVVGRIDRIDRIGGPDSRQVAIVDYKTGSPRSEDDAAKGLQLSVYALAAARQWGFEPARMAFHNLEDDTIVSAEPESGRLKEAEAKIARAAAGIAAGEFEPKPSPFTCKRCQYQAICPATEETLYVIRSAAKASLN